MNQLWSGEDRGVSERLAQTAVGALGPLCKSVQEEAVGDLEVEWQGSGLCMWRV